MLFFVDNIKNISRYYLIFNMSEDINMQYDVLFIFICEHYIVFLMDDKIYVSIEKFRILIVCFLKLSSYQMIGYSH